MYKKTILLILGIILVGFSINAQAIEVKIKPLAGIFSPTASKLSGYYDKELILYCGAEAKLITPVFGLGGFVSISTYSVNIDDPDELGDPHEKKSIIITAGVLKEVDLVLFDLYAKAGITLHSDELSLDNEDTRTGFLIGVEISKQIYPSVHLNLGLDYDNNNLTVPEYVNVTYSRHQSFLSNADINSGGIFIYAGIEINIL